MSILSQLRTPRVRKTVATDAERPIGVLDIGSNSIRLVVYRRHARALTPQYNEKSSVGLGRGVAATGRLSEDALARALSAIRRFSHMARVMNVGAVHILATSAVREAENGPAFAAEVSAIMGAQTRVLTGAEEAHFAALGVIAGIPEFDGIVGDLGGGSLEFAALRARLDSVGETHELGAIRIEDDAEGDVKKARKIARERLEKSALLAERGGGTFAAIGGTWRSLAKLHQNREDYPLHMIQHYQVPADKIIALCDALVEAHEKGETLDGMKVVSSSRKALLPFGAAVLSETLQVGKFENVVFSATGVREGYLYGLLDREDQERDPLLVAVSEMSALLSRDPAFAEELIGFSDRFVQALGFEETETEKRLRAAACYLSDIGWRGHPDYRGEQAVDLVAYGSLTGVDHPGRAFLSEVLAVRYMGLKKKCVSAAILELSGEKGSERARLLGALMRVAYPLSAGMAGILRMVELRVENEALVLELPASFADLAGERVASRLKQLAQLAGFGDQVIRTRDHT